MMILESLSPDLPYIDHKKLVRKYFLAQLMRPLKSVKIGLRKILISETLPFQTIKNSNERKKSHINCLLQNTRKEDHYLSYSVPHCKKRKIK